MTRLRRHGTFARVAFETIGVTALATFALSCQTLAPSGPRAREEFAVPGGLLATQALRRERFTMRQHLRFSFEDREGRIESVLQKDCESVDVVGLGPFGTRLFSLHQSGMEISHEPSDRAAWPLSPHRILLDIQRIYLYPLPEPAPPDGVTERRVAGVEVVEIWRAGRLFERALPDSSNAQPARVVIQYRGGLGSAEAPPPVHLRDEHLGYELEVETVTYESSECPT